MLRPHIIRLNAYKFLFVFEFMLNSQNPIQKVSMVEESL
jgi:hypothetical protein